MTSLTEDMSFYHCWYLIKDQFLDINPSQSLFHGPSVMSNDLHDLSDKDMIRSDLGIPNLDEFLDDDGNDCVEL